MSLSLLPVAAALAERWMLLPQASLLVPPPPSRRSSRSLHLQWAARGQHPVVGQPMPNGSGGLAQGWFAMGEGRPHPGEWDCHATLNSVVAQAAWCAPLSPAPLTRP